MIASRKSLVLLTVLGLATATAAASGQILPPATGPVQCGIIANTANGMMSLKGQVHTTKALSGSYVFNVATSTGGGNSNVSQGGTFAATADETLTLGTVTINSGARTKIVFEVTADGQTYDCSTTIDALI